MLTTSRWLFMNSLWWTLLSIDLLLRSRNNICDVIYKIYPLPRWKDCSLVKEGENRHLGNRRIIAPDIICTSDPLMRIFLRRRNFHNFLVRGYFEKFCGTAFLLLYRDFVISLNSKHEITRVLRNLRHSDSIWENVISWERKLAVWKITILVSSEYVYQNCEARWQAQDSNNFWRIKQVRTIFIRWCSSPK